MATHKINDLYDGMTYHLIAGSTEYFILNMFESLTDDEVDLSSISNIEWFIGSASVKNRYSEIEKSLQRGEIVILKDEKGNFSNVIQVVLTGDETKNLQGGYRHQILITDEDGNKFRPLQGILVFDSALLSSK